MRRAKGRAGAGNRLRTAALVRQQLAAGGVQREQQQDGTGEFKAEQGGGEERGAGWQQQHADSALLPLSACLPAPPLHLWLLGHDEFGAREGSSNIKFDPHAKGEAKGHKL